MGGTKFYMAVGLLFIVEVSACGEDKAKADYDKCREFEAKGDIVFAFKLCSIAASKDPHSKSGQAAAAKVKELKPAYDRAKKAEDAADAKAAAEKTRANEAARAAEEKARAARLATALGSATIERESWSDGSCLSVGLPPKAYRFAATPADADLIASVGGCSRRHDVTSLEQCCPADFEARMQAVKAPE